MSDSTLANAALTEREKMEAGLPYKATDGALMELRLQCRKLLQQYNNYPVIDYKEGMKPSDFFGPTEKFQILAKLFNMDVGKVEKNLSIQEPFYCDHGVNIEFKGEFYCNFNTTILDCAKVTIGHRVMFAPNVNIYAATHNTDVQKRRDGEELAFPVVIGNDCWIGGQVTIIGPCTIGNGTTIAAGAVVRGTWPDNVVLGGVPARILKRLDPPPTLIEN